MGFLSGKRLLITGVLSNRSIAYGIAQVCRREGAELAFSYVGDRFKERITEIAAEFGSDLVFDMDVSDDAQIAAAFDALKRRWRKPPRRTDSLEPCRDSHHLAEAAVDVGDFRGHAGGEVGQQERRDVAHVLDRHVAA